MQWFKHFNDARHNPKFRVIEKQLGEAGYARAFKLLEIVAQQGGKADRFSPRLDLRNVLTNFDWLAEELRISATDARATLETFAVVRFIDPKQFRKQVVYIPQMLEYLDEWTQRRQRSKSSRETPETLPSDSGPTPAQSKSKRKSTEKEAEAEIEARKEKAAAATAAADALLKRKTEDCWKTLGILPCGSDEFQEIWENLYGDSLESEKLADVMERCIQGCQSTGIRVPKPFYDAKRGVERREESDFHFPEAECHPL